MQEKNGDRRIDMSNARYTVTVTEIVTEKRVLPRKWEKGGEGNPENYGYAPEVETLQTVERKVYEQSKGDVNLLAVIMAVNGL